jgi:hypothetical protein
MLNIAGASAGTKNRARVHGETWLYATASSATIGV